MKWCTCLCFLSPALSLSLHPAIYLPIQGQEHINAVSDTLFKLTHFITHTPPLKHVEFKPNKRNKRSLMDLWVCVCMCVRVRVCQKVCYVSFLTKCLASLDNSSKYVSSLFWNPLVESSSWRMALTEIDSRSFLLTLTAKWRLNHLAADSH